MLDLQEIRNKIDEIDAGILSSFEKRMELAEQVAAYKISAGKPVFDGKREAEKLKNLEEAASTLLTPGAPGIVPAHHCRQPHAAVSAAG